MGVRKQHHNRGEEKKKARISNVLVVVVVVAFSKKEEGERKRKVVPRYDRYDFGAAAGAAAVSPDSTLGPAAAARRSFTR